MTAIEKQWVPVTDEIVTALYEEYCAWLEMTPEERAQYAALRQYEKQVAALAEQNGTEHQAWQNAIDEWQALHDALGVELGERRREGRVALNDEQKSHVDAAMAKIDVTYAAWKACLPEMPDTKSSWRKEQEALRDAAENEWIAFGGACTQEQLDAWKNKHAMLSLPFNKRLNPLSILPPSPKPTRPLMKSAADLQHRTFEPVRYVVPGYLAEGCTILAGKPKLGKSWLMLDCGLAVAAGGCLLGTKAVQGDVLYLALEDNERRLKNRIQKVLGPFVDWPKRLTYATEWPRADEGGLDQIEAWIKSVPKATLVVVDVLQRFRAAQGGSQNAYAVDYAAVAGLQALASKYGVALVIVHHLRKNAADNDPFDKVSGTLGLSGAADSILILDRDGSGGTVLYGRGRDIEEIETAVRFDGSLCRWSVLGAASEVRKSDERKTIITALKEAKEPMPPADIAAATGMPPNNVRRLLFKMTRNGDVSKDGKGYVANTPGNTGNAVTPVMSVAANQPIIPPPPC